jgi:hypothetical protein
VHTTIERLLLCNGAVNTFFNKRKPVFSVGSALRLYNEDLNGARIRIGSRSRDGSHRGLRINGKKGIRRSKEDFM